MLPGRIDTGETSMAKVLLIAGRLSGLIGVGLSILAVIVRLTNTYSLAGFQIGTVLQAAIAAMAFGSLCYCASLAERPRE